MASVKSWKVSNKFWEKVEPFIPPVQRLSTREYKRKVGGGRKPLPARQVFEGIIYVLRTGCQWQALPKERFGSPSSVYTYFSKWLMAGFFLNLWRAGLAEYDEMEGIAWEWQSGDGGIIKAPMAQELVGPNPTDRGKKWKQAPFAGGRTWGPSVVRRNRGQCA
jgi:transposase